MLIVFLLVCATYIWVLFFTRIPFMVNCTINTTLIERLQHLQQVCARLVEMSESEKGK